MVVSGRILTEPDGRFRGKTMRTSRTCTKACLVGRHLQVSDTFLRQKNLVSFRLGLQLLLKGKPNGMSSGKDTRLKNFG